MHVKTAHRVVSYLNAILLKRRVTHACQQESYTTIKTTVLNWFKQTMMLVDNFYRLTVIILGLIVVSMQVKKIMEESVTKKFVHEDSGSVTLFCGKYM